MADINKSITATIKSISDKKNLIFFFKKNFIKIEGNKVYLPDINSIKNKIDLQNFRGIADFLALKLKFHNSYIYNDYKPKKTNSIELFEALEEARIISLGSFYMKGIASNLKLRLDLYCKKNQFNKIKKRNNSQITQVIKLFATQHFIENKIPNTLFFLNLWKPIILPLILEDLINLKKNLYNQKGFSDSSLKLIEKLQKYYNKKKINPKKEKQEKKSNFNDKENTNEEEEKTYDISSIAELSKNKNKDFNQEKKQKLLSKKTNQNEILLNQQYTQINNDLKYKIYNNKFDKTIKAEECCTKKELFILNKELLNESKETFLTIKRLAKKLQNKLLTINKTSWNFDEEEGKINNSKLSRVISNLNFKKVFKNFDERKIKNTVVSLLIDNSGSMRGKPIQTAAICSKIISHTLEKCTVKVEILGFTTKEWKGGKSREHWIENNMPSNPGRLNDLMHIIYKTPEDSLKKIKNNFAVMLKDGLLKENIDGESLFWALNRILKRKEERKILMVISDGAPVDDSTISANTSNYLEKHLKKVINFIENKTNVEITAIGIGHNVSKYYKKAVTINDPDQLGGTMIKKFLELFVVKK